MDWYYYLENQLQFPFQGQMHRCKYRFTSSRNFE